MTVDRKPPQRQALVEVRQIADQILEKLAMRLDSLHWHGRAPTIPPDQVLRAWLIRLLFSIRSEQDLLRQIKVDETYRRFVGLDHDGGVWELRDFLKNVCLLLSTGISKQFLDEVLTELEKQSLLAPLCQPTGTKPASD